MKKSLKFIGKLYWDIRSYINHLGIKTNIIIDKNLKFINFISELHNTDWLILIISEREGEIIETGKLPYYIGACKPILTLVPKHNSVVGIVKKNNLGYIGIYENINEITA